MIPEIGRLDLCLNVKNVNQSFDFYSKLGLKKVEGNLEENWAVLAHRNLRLGLFTGHIDDHCLNFRGANVEQISEYAKRQGFIIKIPYKAAEKGGGSMTLLDPDGYILFFDTHHTELTIPSELKSYLKIAYDSEVGIGNCDICLDVKDIFKSQEFYSSIGFELVEGDISENWLILQKNNARLGLFQGEKPSMTINFRDGDINQIATKLKSEGVVFQTEPKLEEDGTMGATLFDPDGYFIYLNT